MLAALILAGLAVSAFGMQVLSRHMQRYSLEARRPDPLIEITGSRRYAARPPELERLTGIVADSLSSDRVARSHLGPILDGLAADAPAAAPGRPDGSTRRVRKRHWLDGRLDELERAWGVDHRPGAEDP